MKNDRSKNSINIMLLSLIAIFFIPKCFTINHNASNNLKLLSQNSDCTIPNFNLWDKIIFDYMKPKKSMDRCNKNKENDFYDLKNGILSVKKKKVKCFYSCKYPIGDHKVKNGRYKCIKQPITLNCDVFHIKCINKDNQIIFQDVNFHIRKLKDIPKEEANFLDPKFKIPPQNKKYDVHLYIVDSLSAFHAKRALNKTRKYILEDLNGVEMNLLNTIGDNSKPNAFGFLLNKHESDVVDFFGKKKVKKKDWGSKISCKIPLDNTTYIQDYFRKMGYITLTGEDFYKSGVFEFPNCVGFRDNVIHHSIKPFQTIRNNPSFKKFKNIINKKFKHDCFKYGFYLMEYMNDFLEKYKYEPKMTMTWQSNLLHNYLGNIFPADEIFYDYLKKNEANFNNSFNIFMGDHGFRMSTYHNTEIGSFEHKNPFFLMTVPEELRSNDVLIWNLKENSNKHISHFDVYATLLDILTNALNDDFKELDRQKEFPIINDKIRGLSLLRPLPCYNRSCYDLNVPPHYCLCTPNIREVSKISRTERRKLSRNFIKTLNNKISIGNLTNKCAQMKLDKSEVFSIKKIISKEKDIVYKVDATTLPGKAKYQALMDKNFKVIHDEIIRMNIYKHQAEVCEKKSDYRIYCYCKKLFKVIKA